MGTENRDSRQVYKTDSFASNSIKSRKYRIDSMQSSSPFSPVSLAAFDRIRKALAVRRYTDRIYCVVGHQLAYCRSVCAASASGQKMPPRVGTRRNCARKSVQKRPIISITSTRIRSLRTRFYIIRSTSSNTIVFFRPFHTNAIVRVRVCVSV